MAKPTALAELGYYELAEGPGWYGDDLVYVDIVGNRIHRHNFKTGAHSAITTDGPVGFAVLDTNGLVIAGIGDGSIWRLSFTSPLRDLLALPARHNPNNLANDGKCDRLGRLWAGTKNSDETAPPSGSLSVMHFDFLKEGRLQEVCHPVHISNGIAFSPDDKRLYYNDSTNKIWAFDYDLATGNATNRRVFVDLPCDDSVPDGMTVDVEGNLYCAMWRGSRVDVYSPKAERIERIEVPTALQVSSVAFGKNNEGGESFDTLYITTASVDLSAVERSRFPQSGMIFALKRNIPGFPATPFNRP